MPFFEELINNFTCRDSRWLTNDQKWIIRTHCKHKHTMDRTTHSFRISAFPNMDPKIKWKKKTPPHFREQWNYNSIICDRDTLRKPWCEKKSECINPNQCSAAFVSLCFTHEFRIDFTHTGSSEDREMPENESRNKMRENKVYIVSDHSRTKAKLRMNLK